MAAILEITPRIVAFGSRLVQLHQVTSVQLASVSPWRGYGRLLIALGGLVLLAVLAVPRAPSATLSNGLELTGSGVPSVVGLLLLGLGLIAYFYSRDFLVIATADGDKLRITSHDTSFMMDVVDAVRAAMSAPSDAPLHYVVNVPERTIERRGAQSPYPKAPVEDDERADTALPAPSHRAAAEIAREAIPSQSARPARPAADARTGDVPQHRPISAEPTGQTARPLSVNRPGRGLNGAHPGVHPGAASGDVAPSSAGGPAGGPAVGPAVGPEVGPATGPEPDASRLAAAAAASTFGSPAATSPAASGAGRLGPFSAAVARSGAAKAGAPPAATMTPTATADSDQPATGLTPRDIDTGAASTIRPGEDSVAASTGSPSSFAAVSDLAAASDAGGSPASGSTTLAPVTHAPAGSAADLRTAAGSTPGTVTARDIDGVVDLLRAGGAPHLDQLIQLLDVVKRHATGQPPRMAEAHQGWTAFSEYAHRYLGDVSGLEAEVARLDRVLMHEPSIAAQ